MAQCSYCNTSIIFGGVRDGDLRFCNQRCQQQGSLLMVARVVPDDLVKKRVAEVHQGPCPQCQRLGSVDVHTAHSIWSAVLLTSWKSTPRVSCTPCGKKAKVTASVGSFFLGWWGFPWGLIGTPIQIGKNLVGLVRTPDAFAPSPELEKIVRLTLAADLQAMQREEAAPPPLKPTR